MKIDNVKVKSPPPVPQPPSTYTITITLSQAELESLAASLWNAGKPTTNALDNLYADLAFDNKLSPVFDEVRRANPKRVLRSLEVDDDGEEL